LFLLKEGSIKSLANLEVTQDSQLHLLVSPAKKTTRPLIKPEFSDKTIILMDLRSVYISGWEKVHSDFATKLRRSKQ
jgi:hypothetical protein